MAIVHLLRHGQHGGPDKGGIPDQADAELTDLGREQALALGKRLSRRRIDAIYSSDMRRAHQTATIVSEAIGREVILRPELREIQRGEWEFKSPDLPEYRRFRAEWDKHLTDLPYPGGENGADLLRRASRVLDEIVQQGYNNAVAVVTHGGVIRALLCACVGLDLAKRFNWHLDNCSITTTEYDESKAAFRVVCVNDTAHLE